MDLVPFLRDRLNEEQAEAEKLADVDDYSLEPWALQWEETGEWNSYSYLRIAKARVLAEVEAKRRMIEAYERTSRGVQTAPRGDMRETARTARDSWLAALKLCALPYADHADYLEKWRP